jgi:hypothetical protein
MVNLYALHVPQGILHLHSEPLCAKNALVSQMALYPDLKLVGLLALALLGMHSQELVSNSPVQSAVQIRLLLLVLILMHPLPFPQLSVGRVLLMQCHSKALVAAIADLVSDRLVLDQL